jgi:hypothetical protein
MVNEELKRVLTKYRHRVIVKGVELLLTPQDAILFIDDLSQIGVRIDGCDLWKYVDRSKHPDRIVELLGAWGLFENYFISSGKTRDEIGPVMKEFILEQMPNIIPEAELVSFVYLDKEIYDFFRFTYE